MYTKKEIALRKKVILNLKNELDFPHFLELLRKAYGYSRVKVCSELGISCTRLFFLEKGLYVKRPDLDLLYSLAMIYKVKFNFLWEKSDKFLSEKKNSPQRYGLRWQKWKMQHFDSMLKEKRASACIHV